MSMEPEKIGAVAKPVAEPLTDVEGAQAGSIAKATSVVGGVRVALIAAGAAWQWLSAPYLGSTPVGNAFNWTNERVTQLFQLWEKFLRPTVIPMFMQERREHGDETAWRLASTLVNLLILLLAVLTALGIAFSSQVVGLLTDFNGEQRVLAVKMLRWMLLAVPFLSLSVMGYLMLNSYKRFGVAALGDLVFKVAMVAGLVALLRFWGWPALVLAMVCGGALKFGMYVWGLRKEGTHYRPVLDLRSPAMKRFYVLVLPLLVGALVALGRDYYEGFRRTGVEEGRAASLVRYARMGVDLPIQVLMLPLGIAIFPFISEAAAKGKHRELFSGFFTICRGIFLVFVPMTVGMILLRTPLIHTLLEWGKFQASDTSLTSETLFYYAFGYVPFALEIVILQYFYARQNTMIPTAAGVATSTLNVLFLWAVIPYLGIGTFTLATVVTKTLKVIFLVMLLKMLFHEELPWGSQLRRLGSGVLRVAVATAVMWLVMWGVDAGLDRVLNVARRLDGIVYLGTITLAGAGSFLLMVVLLRVEEVWLAIGWIRNKLPRRFGGVR